MPEQAVPDPATAHDRSAMGTPTVVVSDVHVRYQVNADQRRTLREIVAAPLSQRRQREVHALKGVSLTAHAGEVIGVIGSNGSGKSTLMRAISGLQPVTAGTVDVRSTPMLLGVGAVLNRTLSGRRNILLGGLALGMTKEQVLEREQQIIDFSGIGHAIDLPMRTYSSGMSARLQFAISAAVEPEILIVDEALAVGDQSFRDASNRRIQELRASAGTVFLVSHSLRSLAKTCTRVIWIEDGVIKRDGDPREIIREYREPLRKARRGKQQRKKKRQQRRRRQQARLAQSPAAAGPRPQVEAGAPEAASAAAPAAAEPRNSPV